MQSLALISSVLGTNCILLSRSRLALILSLVLVTPVLNLTGLAYECDFVSVGPAVQLSLRSCVRPLLRQQTIPSQMSHSMTMETLVRRLETLIL